MSQAATRPRKDMIYGALFLLGMGLVTFTTFKNRDDAYAQVTLECRSGRADTQYVDWTTLCQCLATTYINQFPLHYFIPIIGRLAASESAASRAVAVAQQRCAP